MNTALASEGTQPTHDCECHSASQDVASGLGEPAAQTRSGHSCCGGANRASRDVERTNSCWHEAAPAGAAPATRSRALQTNDRLP